MKQFKDLRGRRGSVVSFGDEISGSSPCIYYSNLSDAMHSRKGMKGDYWGSLYTQLSCMIAVQPLS